MKNCCSLWGDDTLNFIPEIEHQVCGISDITQNQENIIRLDDDIWKLEHVTKHKEYAQMKQAEWNGDAGSNIFM
ncbi:hypothetical protein JYT48_01105 [Mariprofundus ferrooxydans]|nr:hypothetical protein [Mariprofundus ferrooxydans]